MNDYQICANCGENVPPQALACPECGSDEETGWSDETLYDGLDLPDENTSEFDEESSRSVFFQIIAILVLIAFLMTLIL